MKKTLLAIAALTALTSGAAMAQQQDGKWMVRMRAVHIDSSNGGSTNLDLGLSVSNKTIPELDISYFFTPNFAAELILTYPQKHDVRSGALGAKIGSVKQLLPHCWRSITSPTLALSSPTLALVSTTPVSPA